jgi:mannan endo-1,6-alpha-mannosidase
LKKKNWNIADTTNVDANCKDHGDWQWTYNYATYIAGAGYMYNYVSREHLAEAPTSHLFKLET